jgi:hypothetical protein
MLIYARRIDRLSTFGLSQHTTRACLEAQDGIKMQYYSCDFAPISTVTSASSRRRYLMRCYLLRAFKFTHSAPLMVVMRYWIESVCYRTNATVFQCCNAITEPVETSHYNFRLADSRHDRMSGMCAILMHRVTTWIPYSTNSLAAAIIDAGRRSPRAFAVLRPTLIA